MSLSFGAALGPVIGAVLYLLGGYRFPFAVFGFAFAVCCIPAIIFIPSTHLPQINANSLEEILQQPEPISQWQLLKSSCLSVTMCVTAMCTAIPMAFLPAALEPHLRQFDLSLVTIGLIISTCLMVNTVCLPIGGALIDYISHTRWSPHGLRPPIIALSALTLLIVGPSPLTLLPRNPVYRQLYIIIIGLVLLAPLSAIISVGAIPQLLDYLHREKGYPNSMELRTGVSGLIITSQMMGTFLGPTVGMGLVTLVGFTKTIGIISIALLAMATWGALAKFGFRRCVNRHSEILLMERTNEENSSV